MRTRFAAAAALTLVAAAAAGCGSSDDEGTSKAEFTKKADAICAKGDRKINAAAQRVFRTSTKRPSQAKLTKFIKTDVLPPVREQVEALKKLETPKGDEDKVKAITDAADDSLAKVEANPKLGAGQGKKDPFAKAKKLSRDYGLKTCGSDSG
jgi:hypothetical protein